MRMIVTALMAVMFMLVDLLSVETDLISDFIVLSILFVLVTVDVPFTVTVIFITNFLSDIFGRFSYYFVAFY